MSRYFREKTLVLVLTACALAFLVGCLAVPRPAASDKAVLQGKVVVPASTRQLQGQALSDATVKIIDPKTGQVIATTTTDSEGNYSVEVPAGGPYIIQAEKGNLKVLDVSPQVEPGKSYSCGTADATSTALALLFQAQVNAGQDPAQIDLNALAQAQGFGNLVNAVENALSSGQDPTASSQVNNLVNNIVNPPSAPASPEGPATDTTPPRLVGVRANFIYGGERSGTNSITCDLWDSVQKIKVIVSEPVEVQGTPKVWIDLGQDYVEYGKLYPDTNDSTNRTLLVTPNDGNEKCGLLGTFTFKVEEGAVKDLAGNPNAETTFTLNVEPPEVQTRVYFVENSSGEAFVEVINNTPYAYLVFDTYYPEVVKEAPNEILIDAKVDSDNLGSIDLSGATLYYHQWTNMTGLPSVLASKNEVYDYSPLNKISPSTVTLPCWLSEILSSGYPTHPPVNYMDKMVERYVLKVPVKDFLGRSVDVKYTVVAAQEGSFGSPDSWSASWEGSVEETIGNPPCLDEATVRLIQGGSSNYLELVVDAYDMEGLYELEVDHNLGDPWPEFSVYASETDPYGGQGAAFNGYGVSVTYDDATQKWTIKFGGNAFEAMKNGVTFYIVIKDRDGNNWGSMYEVKEDNTISYTP